MKKGREKGMYPYTKKVRQGAFLLFAYMLAAGLTAGAARAIAAAEAQAEAEARGKTKR